MSPLPSGKFLASGSAEFYLSGKVQKAGFSYNDGLILTSSSARRKNSLLPAIWGSDVDLSATACASACVSVDNSATVAAAVTSSSKNLG